VIQTLAEHEYVQIHAGRSGGITMNRDPALIRLGEVIRIAEPNMRLVECFDRRTNTCKIAPVCALKGMLKEGLDSFIATLNRYTLAEILGDGGQQKLVKIFA
jgi:Rrf2 family nitric oxide-sensitive transcriptional repressor